MTYAGPEPVPDNVPRVGAGDYVARKPCGCYTAWISGDEPAARKAKWIAKKKREGFQVFSCRTEWARENLRTCHCEDQGRLDL